MKLIKSILVLTTLSVVVSCSPKEVAEAVKIEKYDSLVEKINSPELKIINQLLINETNNDSLYNQRAKIYINFRQFDEAMGDVNRALKIDSTKGGYYVTLADIYFATNKTRQSKETLEKAVRKFPTNTEALLKLGELFFLVRQYENAILYINNALKVDENIAQAYYLKGSVFKEMGDTSKAISSMQTAIEQDNKYFDAFLDIGILYSSRKNPLAMEYYNNALKLRPADENTLYAKAKLLQDLNKIEESIALYQQILSANKNNKNVLYNLGAISLDKKKDAKKAIDYFSNAIAIDPKYTEAYFARGVSFDMLKDKDNAKADYNMCLEITPNYEPALDALNKK